MFTAAETLGRLVQVSSNQFVCCEPVVKMDRRIRWHYTTTILRLRIGARLTRYRNCKFHNFARTISRHADGISRYCVPPSRLVPAPAHFYPCCEQNFITTSPITVMSVSVCPRSYLRNYTSDLNHFLHVTYGRDSILLWRRSDTLCTSGLWMTSYLLISQGCSTSPPSWSAVHTQPWTWL